MEALVFGIAGLAIAIFVAWVVVRSATRATGLLDELRRVTVLQRATIERLDALGAMVDNRLDVIERRPPP